MHNSRARSSDVIEAYALSRVAAARIFFWRVKQRGGISKCSTATWVLPRNCYLSFDEFRAMNHGQYFRCKALANLKHLWKKLLAAEEVANKFYKARAVQYMVYQATISMVYHVLGPVNP